MIKTISQQNGYSTHNSHCHIMAIFQILQFKILKAIFQAFGLSTCPEIRNKKHWLLTCYKNIMRKKKFLNSKWFLFKSFFF
jgi:hypothetical protein